MGATTAGTSVLRTSACNFYGLPSHYIQECEAVIEYTQNRKCKHSPEGRVVLPSGAIVLCSITRTWLYDHVEEWHWLNPRQMAAHMLFEVATLVSAPPNDTAGQSNYSHPM